MKSIRLYLLLLPLTLTAAYGQETQEIKIRPVSFYVGLQPGISLAGYDDYDRPLININLLPVTFEYAINRHVGFRLNPIWELQIRPEFPTELSTVGAEIAIPYYFSKKNSEEGQRGFYGAPVLTPAFYRLNNYYSLGLALEAGYAILFGRGWSLALAGQVGFKLQMAQNNPYMRIVPDTAPRLAVGVWF
ncbi:MAG: hypothetical protein R6V75_05965 [Bacteroidales bacterium]